MDRIEAIPGRGCGNYRDFSRLPDLNEPIVDFTREHARVGQSQLAARKKYPSEELKSPLAESIDAADWQLSDNRRRADVCEPIEAACDPIDDLIGRNSIQHIVADIGHEGGSGERWTIL
jgi:hypothetical protein